MQQTTAGCECACAEQFRRPTLCSLPARRFASIGTALSNTQACTCILTMLSAAAWLAGSVAAVQSDSSRHSYPLSLASCMRRPDIKLIGVSGGGPGCTSGIMTLRWPAGNKVACERLRVNAEPELQAAPLPCPSPRVLCRRKEQAHPHGCVHAHVGGDAREDDVSDAGRGQQQQQVCVLAGQLLLSVRRVRQGE